MKVQLLSRRFVTAALIAAIFIAVGGQQIQPQNAPSVERLRAHIEFLASDKLEGRRTGSPGANLAAEYIAREFSRYGLRRSIGRDLPGMSILEADSPKRYLQEFPYIAGVELGKGNELSFAQEKDSSMTRLRVAEDWMPLGLSVNTKIERAEYIFVGYGITATELKYNSYSLAAKDRIAIALAGTPDGDNPHGQFARYEDVRWKAIAARNAGVKALLIIANEKNFNDDRLSRLHYNNSGGDAGLPVAVISQQAAARLFPSLNISKDLISALTELAQQTSNAENSQAFITPAMITSLPLKGITLSISTNVIRRQVLAYNVVGIRDGSDPILKKEVVVIGAHYDHLGRGGEGSLAAKEGDIHYGADDNASGVAGLLELARIFSEQESRPRRTIVFIAFSGEEEGLLGSNYYVNHPIVPLANTVAMINMDMIGRMKNNKLIVGGMGTSQEWRELVENANRGFTPYVIGTVSGSSASEGRAVMGAYDPKTTDNDKKPQFLLTLNEDGFGPSDHSSFYAKQIPVLFFWTGTHEDYHKPSDTADKINYPDEARIVGVVARVVRDLDANDKKPTYTVAKSESTGRSTGFRVYLGTIPNYADSNDGLLLDGVRDDSPAAKAGIKGGDRIVKLAGRDVHNVYDYTYALGEMKAGQEYEVELLRGGERLKLKLTPAARK